MNDVLNLKSQGRTRSTSTKDAHLRPRFSRPRDDLIIGPLRLWISLALIHQKLVLGAASIFRLDAVDTIHCDREGAFFRPLRPPFFPEIPDVKFEMRCGTVQQRLEFDIACSGVSNVLSEPHIEQRQQFHLELGVSFDASVITRFLRKLPTYFGTRLVSYVVVGSSERICERAVSFHDDVNRLSG